MEIEINNFDDLEKYLEEYNEKVNKNISTDMLLLEPENHKEIYNRLLDNKNNDFIINLMKSSIDNLPKEKSNFLKSILLSKVFELVRFQQYGSSYINNSLDLLKKIPFTYDHPLFKEKLEKIINNSNNYSDEYIKFFLDYTKILEKNSHEILKNLDFINYSIDDFLSKIPLENLEKFYLLNTKQSNISNFQVTKEILKNKFEVVKKYSSFLALGALFVGVGATLFAFVESTIATTSILLGFSSFVGGPILGLAGLSILATGMVKIYEDGKKNINFFSKNDYKDEIKQKLLNKSVGYSPIKNEVFKKVTKILENNNTDFKSLNNKYPNIINNNVIFENKEIEKNALLDKIKKQALNQTPMIVVEENLNISAKEINKIQKLPKSYPQYVKIIDEISKDWETNEKLESYKSFVNYIKEIAKINFSQKELMQQDKEILSALEISYNAIIEESMAVKEKKDTSLQILNKTSKP